MMNLLQGASDDQVALIGCVVALVSSAGLMYLSYFVGPASRQQNKTADATATIKSLRPKVDAPHERAA